MTKKVYLQPVMTVSEIDLHVQILAGSVQTTGLGENPEDELTQDVDNPTGNAWDDAMSRRRNRNVWEDEELLEEEEDW